MYKILIVDDTAENLKVIIDLISKLHPNYILYQVLGAEKGLVIADKMLPNLIITDWDMPKVNGLNFVKQLKSNKRTHDIPVIMATGVMITSENLSLALESGCIDYIRKPVDPIELEARMHSAIKLIEYQKNKILFENNKLIENALYLARNNEFILEMKDKLADFANLSKLTGEEQEMLNLIIEDFDDKVKADSWDRFDVAFQSAHPNFNINLITTFPNLTPTEIRLANFIRMGMSIKSIASVLSQVPESIKVARSRLRKKLNLNTSQNLQTFLSQF